MRIGKYQKKHWDQIAVLSPPIRCMIRQYSVMGLSNSPIEVAIEAYQDFLSRPVRQSEIRPFATGFARMFLNMAGAHISGSSAMQTIGAAYVFSNICNRQIIKLLAEKNNGF